MEAYWMMAMGRDATRWRRMMKRWSLRGDSLTMGRRGMTRPWCSWTDLRWRGSGSPMIDLSGRFRWLVARSSLETVGQG